MEKIFDVRLRDSGPIIMCSSEEELKPSDYVILEYERGIDYGEAISESKDKEFQTKDTIRKILRKAQAKDLEQIEYNRKDAQDAKKICMRKIAEHNLEMKLVNTEYSFDRKKIIFYFTAEGRVDFRKLLKDLAKIFKARIELRQIGVRDEAKLIGGLGPCGRNLCCATFLKDFEPVTMKMAKEEGLPLNPAKISGLCGRLMCCLAYEYSVYKSLSKGLPKEGERIHTKDGKGKVINVNVFKRKVLVELEDGKQLELEL
ncbi:MAG: stage 0 sporulation family protein [Candidatus Omnitrophica bacterium]|nr:stage 0 sporulation family protein [Candidatus Omnitrophota bacterium]